MAESLATGAALTPETWADFRKRLHHDCEGAGVADHCTADVAFIVQKREIITGIDIDYCEPEQRLIQCDDEQWFTPQQYWESQDAAGREKLESEAMSRQSLSWAELDWSDKLELLAAREDHHVYGYQDQWQFLNLHLTQGAAEAFIARKGHVYPLGLRVAQEGDRYAFEFNTIKDAILSGKLLLKSDACAQRYIINWPMEEINEYPDGEVVLATDHLATQAELAHMTKLRDTWYEQCQELRAELAVARQQQADGLDGLAAIGRLIASQSNRSTANPIFAVLEKRETITLDTHHHDRIVWVSKEDGSIEADERTHTRLELLHEDGREPKQWDRYAMLETDVFVTACFTEQGCKDYLACNGHNLRLPFIYAFGSYRNAEYNLIRDTLLSLAARNPVDDDIPDFSPGSGNKARRRAEALGLPIKPRA